LGSVSLSEPFFPHALVRFRKVLAPDGETQIPMAGEQPIVEDEVLARNVWASGDNDSFAELFTRHRKKVFYACWGFFAG